MKETSEVLTEGLMQGFAGVAKPQTVERGGFTGKVSAPELEEGTYHDEWFGRHSGGGQELVSVGDQQFTRLYGGGTADQDILTELGITESEVGSYLVRSINALGASTRLFEDCTPEPDGLWQYSYRITDREEGIGVVSAKEKITYQDTTVFVHNFILSPVI